MAVQVPPGDDDPPFMCRSSTSPHELSLANTSQLLLPLGCIAMFSYVIGGIAVLIFLINPISEFFFPQQANTRRDHSQPPQLNESLLAINPPNFTLPECPPDAYVAHILRSQPLVVYLENFLSQDEREHLLNIRYALPSSSLITKQTTYLHSPLVNLFLSHQQSAKTAKQHFTTPPSATPPSPSSPAPLP